MQNMTFFYQLVVVFLFFSCCCCCCFAIQFVQASFRAIIYFVTGTIPMLGRVRATHRASISGSLSGKNCGGDSKEGKMTFWMNKVINCSLVKFGQLCEDMIWALGFPSLVLKAKLWLMSEERGTVFPEVEFTIYEKKKKNYLTSLCIQDIFFKSSCLFAKSVIWNQIVEKARPPKLYIKTGYGMRERRCF